MSTGYRFMRLVVFFDLPTLTKADLRRYTLFVRFLKKEGFCMTQKSVYTKILLNGTMANLMMDRLKKNAPENGVIQMLLVTEKQFNSMTYVSGEKKSVIEDSDSRLVRF